MEMQSGVCLAWLAVSGFFGKDAPLPPRLWSSVGIAAFSFAGPFSPLPPRARQSCGGGPGMRRWQKRRLWLLVSVWLWGARASGDRAGVPVAVVVAKASGGGSVDGAAFAAADGGCPCACQTWSRVVVVVVVVAAAAVVVGCGGEGDAGGKGRGPVPGARGGTWGVGAESVVAVARMVWRRRVGVTVGTRWCGLGC